MNRHREVIYADRRAVVKGEDMSAKIEEFIAGEIEDIVERNSDDKSHEINDEAILEAYLALIPNADVTEEQFVGLDQEGIIEVLLQDARAPTTRSRVDSVPRSCARSSGRSCWR